MLQFCGYKHSTAAFAFAATCVLWSLPTRADEEAWKYIANEDAGFSTQLRFLTLDQAPPENIEVEFERAETSKFAQLRYGSFDSRRTVMMVVPSDNGVQLFVDRNHDRRLSPNERIAGEGGEWTISLDAEFIDGTVTIVDKRQVRLRYSKGRLSAGTVGYVQGQIELDGQLVTVRRVDANANGQFADAVDQVWVDLNRDGKWNVFNERYSMSPFVRIQDVTYTCSTDLRGQRFALSKMEATGMLELQVPDELRSRGLVKLSSVMAGRAGSIVHLDLNTKAVEVPADGYRPISVIATFERPESPKVWTFQFVGSNVVGETAWTKVESKSTAAIDPLNSVTFGISLDGQNEEYAGGTTVVMQPTLSTIHGLQIQAVYYGRDVSESAYGPRASMTVTEGGSSQTVGECTSGFT